MKLISGLVASALGHGRMMEPPSRSSYRLLADDPSIAPFWDLVVPNWQDNELFCGGFGVQVKISYSQFPHGFDCFSKRCTELFDLTNNLLVIRIKGTKWL